MTSTRRITAVAAAAVALTLGAAACSSDDETSTESTTSTTRPAAGGGTNATVNPDYETWCTSLQNLIEQSSPGDLSALADLASFTEAVQSLASTSPEPIATQMQTIATASQAKLETAEGDPEATLPPDVAQQVNQAAEDVSVFVFDNCGGLQMPTLDL